MDNLIFGIIFISWKNFEPRLEIEITFFYYTIFNQPMSYRISVLTQVNDIYVKIIIFLNIKVV